MLRSMDSEVVGGYSYVFAFPVFLSGNGGDDRECSLSCAKRHLKTSMIHSCGWELFVIYVDTPFVVHGAAWIYRSGNTRLVKQRVDIIDIILRYFTSFLDYLGRFRTIVHWLLVAL